MTKWTLLRHEGAALEESQAALRPKEGEEEVVASISFFFGNQPALKE